ncbi:hypothetical protein AYK24_03365 [Thermoplasmatales archaeon SG8-52-4]|nr:MAG: hypothetical protein AYK24_03365 [Thermoplasmatales archaeon SG8-52-4]
MLFNSLDFAVFFLLFFIIYWALSNKKLWIQNFFVIISSYVFYGWWDWRFLSLILFSSFTDYFVGIGLLKGQNKRKRKYLLLVSIIANIGILGFFKYFNFFTDSLVHAFSTLGYQLNGSTLNIILPVGISFYTFQTLSYTIDVYRKKLEPTKDIIAFFAFVSFFPQLVAGPIERATHLLPQFYINRKFNYRKAVGGMRLILWGFFMKLVIADRLALYVDSVYGNVDFHGGLSFMVATLFFAFQIYCDFAGYSNIAIGLSKLLGFELMTNFRRPYFSLSISEFWRRWHISLSTWFRDYVYIPLGGNRVSNNRNFLNLFITFVVSGLWHGAAWTFVIWGGINGLYLILEKSLKTKTNNLWNKLNIKNKPFYKTLISFVITFAMINFAWIFFRSNSLHDAFLIITKVFTLPGKLYLGPISYFIYSIISICILLFVELREEHLRGEYIFLESQFKPIRIISYCYLIIMILMFGVFDGGQFIYFQF